MDCWPRLPDVPWERLRQNHQVQAQIPCQVAACAAASGRHRSILYYSLAGPWAWLAQAEKLTTERAEIGEAWRIPGDEIRIWAGVLSQDRRNRRCHRLVPAYCYHSGSLGADS